MTKVYCADISCKFNKDGICKERKIALAWQSVVTLNDGRQDFNKCRSYEESEQSKEIKEYFAQRL